MSKTFPVAAVTLFLEYFRREISLGELTRQDHQRWIYFQDFKLLRESPMRPFGNQLGFNCVESKFSKEIKNHSESLRIKKSKRMWLQLIQYSL